MTAQLNQNHVGCLMDSHTRLWKFAIPFLSLLVAASAYSAPPITLATDLQSDAKQVTAHDAVFLLVFSLPGCRPCEEIETNYLSSLQRDPRYHGKVLIRMVDDLAGDRRLVDFTGAQLSQRDLAAKYKARLAPTLVFVDAKGNSVAEPLIGGDTAGFYGAYLDASLKTAMKTIRHD
ncbi:thioredoxin [Pandoraea terrae]|uniref:Thioredoxin n=1 Tax=Pandoraea terrae TaxID=1537710 RepID=A0A5E4Y1Z0_9BURK|nr:hypothetical protein [Pandoraea terrae]VVE42322.1 thioredoxin [Pandoraea terrae]